MSTRSHPSHRPPPRRVVDDDDDEEEDESKGGGADDSLAEEDASDEDDRDRASDLSNNPFANPFYKKNNPIATAISASTVQLNNNSSRPSLNQPSQRRTAQMQSHHHHQQEEDESDLSPSDEEDEEDDDYEEDDLDEEEDEPLDEDGEGEDEFLDEEVSTKKYKQPKLKFDLATFSGAFDGGAFVSDLTRDLFDQQDPNDFDPTPFTTLFDNAIQRLNTLRDETDQRIQQYAQQCKRDEDMHKENLLALQEQLSIVMSQFNRLDSRISSVAHTAVRIGHTLQAVDAAKRSNIQGQEIIAHFIAFNEGQREKLPAIYNTSDPSELHRAAELIQMLSNISQDLRVKGTERATELIASTSNRIENQLIERFDQASLRQNVDEMKACAATLLNFRGKSLIKRYVFNVIEKLDSYAQMKEQDASSPQLPVTRNRTASVEDGAGFQAALQMQEALQDKTLVGNFRVRLLRFYRGVSLAMKEQVAICDEVFPQPLIIMKALLERVFQDKIQGLIDSGLNDRRLSIEEYLRCLEFAHAHTVELVAGLQSALRGMGASHRSSSNPLGLPRSTSASSSANGGSGEPVSMMNLMDQLAGIFASYREKYFDRELQLVQQVCAGLVEETLNKESPRTGSIDPDADTDIFGRVKKTVLQDQKQQWVLMVLEYPVVDKMIQQCVTSLARCDKLSDPSLISEHSSILFLHVASTIFETYLQPILDVASESLPPLEPKQEPDPFFYQVVGLMNLVVDKLTLHHAHWIVSRVNANPNIQLVTDARLRELTSKLETQLCAGLARLLSSSLKYCTRLLSSKQKAQDYRPREDDSDAVLDGRPSQACEAWCAFISSQYEAILTCLDGKNLDKFLTIFGLKLHESEEQHDSTMMVAIVVVTMWLCYVLTCCFAISSFLCLPFPLSSSLCQCSCLAPSKVFHFDNGRRSACT